VNQQNYFSDAENITPFLEALYEARTHWGADARHAVTYKKVSLR
jgi:hypothetical protein